MPRPLAQYTQSRGAQGVCHRRSRFGLLCPSLECELRGPKPALAAWSRRESSTLGARCPYAGRCHHASFGSTEPRTLWWGWAHFHQRLCRVRWTVHGRPAARTGHPGWTLHGRGDGHDDGAELSGEGRWLGLDGNWCATPCHPRFWTEFSTALKIPSRRSAGLPIGLTHLQVQCRQVCVKCYE